MSDAIHVSPALALLCALWLVPSAVRAEDEDLRLMREPADYTDVIDAFDHGDPFDLNLTLAFDRRTEEDTIQREVVTRASTDGRVATGRLDVSSARRVTNTLLVGLEFGLFRDLAFSLQVPITLSDKQELSMPDSATCSGCSAQRAAVREALRATTPDAPDPDAPDQFLYDPSSPIASKTRSGVPSVNLGLAYGIFNQYRRPDLPTWVVGMEVQIGTADVMRPCLESASCEPGISRGTLALVFDTRMSRRIGMVEPYLGLNYLMEFVTSGAHLFRPGGDLAGNTDSNPPRIFTATAGMAVVPWEDRGRFQRFSIDTRFFAAHVSSGRDFTALFDVLGSSSSPYLTEPNYDRLVSDQERRTEVPFTGLTAVDSHARLGLSLAVVMQAARYIKFRLGGGAFGSTGHLLTGTDACNAEVDAPPTDPRVGGCGAGIINPVHRPVIDIPGTRFHSAGALTWNLYAAATGQF